MPGIWPNDTSKMHCGHACGSRLNSNLSSWLIEVVLIHELLPVLFSRTEGSMLLDIVTSA